MRSMRRVLVPALMIGVVVCASLAQSPSDQKSRNRLLESELALAKASGSYMVIDLAGGSISLRARGMVLKAWDIGSSRKWGERIPMKTLELKEKSALRPPRRTNITPGKEEAKPAAGASTATASSDPDLGILELKDMPIHYDLIFDDEIRVSIRPKTKHFGAWMTNMGKTLGWYVGLPIKSVFRTIKKRPFTEISVVMTSEKDAREIYWAFLDGHQTIIIP